MLSTADPTTVTVAGRRAAPPGAGLSGEPPRTGDARTALDRIDPDAPCDHDGARVEFSDCGLDVGRHELRPPGEVVPLELQVFDVHAFLVRQDDRLVSKFELLDEVWSGVTGSCRSRR